MVEIYGAKATCNFSFVQHQAHTVGIDQNYEPLEVSTQKGPCIK